ncbi:unnamed protein product [Candidula unifasciata]|uniref:Nose resistant-to-fluoxetine protein N-terminal domain-containing protein n=1 Tax=Candidula unifasciata TaxID=100452 RepID=A0A8S3YQA6_9EUPU|nr:unnamed protein product [Candidula unifasciata]
MSLQLLVSTWNDVGTWPKRTQASSSCELDVERAIIGYQSDELWALQLFDAWATPGPSLLQGRSMFAGSYSQCKETRAPDTADRAGFKGNYCVVVLLNLTHPVPRTMILMTTHLINVGVCLPDTCTGEDITRLFQERIQSLIFSSIFAVASVDCRSEEKEYDIFTKLAIAISAVILILTAAGSTLDVCMVDCASSPHQAQQNNKLTPVTHQESNQTQKANSITAVSAKENGVLITFLLSFSAWTNGKRLLSTSQTRDNIAVISGIRFLSMAWIVTGHTLSFLLMSFSDNVEQALPDIYNWHAYRIILNLHYAVDTFFTLSGFLVAHKWLKPVMEKGWAFNWRYFFLHRYWRLTPPLMIAVVLVQGYQGLLVSGAIAATMQPSDKFSCQKNWWQLPLYVNNIVTTDILQQCMGQTWSLAVDMQFYLLSPLMLIPFYYHRLAGVFSCLLFVVAQWTYVGWLYHHYQWTDDFLSITTEWMAYYYIHCYTRVAPFAMGILTAYILSAKGGRVKMSRNQVIIGWTLATVAVYTVACSHPGHGTNSSLTTLYSVTERSIWAAAVLWIIVACVSGYGGPVNAILSWTPFTVLSRITYMGYLVHICIMNVIFANLERYVYINLWSTAAFAAASLFYTCVVAGVLAVLVEFPLLSLEKIFVGQTKKVK